MENTKQILEVIRNHLNTNPIARMVVDEMAENAERLGYTKEQWEQAKIAMMTNIFYKMALDHEDIKAKIAEDVWNMYN